MINEESHDWIRPQYQMKKDDSALLYYLLFGEYEDAFEFVYDLYNTNGLPSSLSLSRYSRSDDDEIFLGIWDYYATKRLLDTAPDLHAAIKSANSCLRILGTIDDVSTLNYLRDTIGIITAVADSNTAGIFDALSLKWWTPKEWRRSIFESSNLNLENHVRIIISESEGLQPEHYWIHTRGLKKFGQPDLGVTDVTAEEIPKVTAALEHVINMQIAGARFDDGRLVNVNNGGVFLKCELVGDEDDLDFNNKHLDLYIDREYKY